MENITKIDIGEGYASKLKMREALYEERAPSELQAQLIARVGEWQYQHLIAHLLERHLTFEMAFAAACNALRATNKRLEHRFFSDLPSFGEFGDKLAAREMLSNLAVKEAWAHLSPDEVAGLVTATHLDIMRYPDYGPRVIETCGMGGDRGITKNGVGNCKTINGSTLSSLVLAAMGHKAVKHGSYANTSSVGSTNAIEELGVIVDIPSVEVQNALAAKSFHFTDAHAWKTIHDLSHLMPRRETVNHIIGPMTPPVHPGTRLNKVLGVNDKLHPDIVAEAYKLLHQHGVLNVGNVAVVAGLAQVVSKEDADLHHRLRHHIILDELSPIASAVTFVGRGELCGIWVLKPSDFGTEFNNPHAPFIPNKPDVIYNANLATLRGQEDGRQLVDLLAMNAALALYLHEYMDDDAGVRLHGPSQDALRDCFRRCKNALLEGQVQQYLESLVSTSRTHAGLD